MSHPLRLMSVGILGGGQLARMLVEAAFRLGLKPIVYAKSPKDPAAQVCPDIVTGDFEDSDSLRKFFAKVSRVIFENEFVSCDVLEKASRGHSISFFPELKTIRLFQDKLSQKEFLAKHKIPMAPFLILKPGDNPKAWVSYLGEHFSGPCVLKWARLGYDGKGVFLMDHTRKNLEQAVQFCEQAQRARVSVFAEAMIRFKRELAVIGCYSVKKKFSAYPLVISEQDEGICARVYGPATVLGVSQNMETKAQTIAHRIAEKASLYGCFGIEFFETDGGELLVNEIAPRVHNSGHYTLDACETGQFENHWRAVLNLPLGNTRALTGFVMQNLMGRAGMDLPEEKAVFPVPTSQMHVNWYGKERISPRRKVGHLNGITGETPSRKGIQRLLREMEICYREWIKQLESLSKKIKK